MKKISYLAAAVAGASAVAIAAPASATVGPDAALTMEQTSGVQGFFGSGVGTISNKGTQAIPAGMNLNFGVKNVHPSMDVHAIIVTPNGGGLVTFPISINSTGIRTTQALEPGQTLRFSWTVLHYAPWHRVSAGISTAGVMPGGVQDADSSNNEAITDHNGEGM